MSGLQRLRYEPVFAVVALVTGLSALVLGVVATFIPIALGAVVILAIGWWIWRHGTWSAYLRTYGRRPRSHARPKASATGNGVARAGYVVPTLTDRIWDALLEHGTGAVRPGTEYLAGYLVEESPSGAVIRWGFRKEKELLLIADPRLELCAEIVRQSGFLVSEDQDDLGPYLDVSLAPEIKPTR